MVTRLPCQGQRQVQQTSIATVCTGSKCIDLNLAHNAATLSITSEKLQRNSLTKIDNQSKPKMTSSVIQISTPIPLR